MLITKYIECDIGHRITNHRSKCKNLHGHRYRIVVGVDDKIINQSGASDEGMVIDFSDLKELMMTNIDGVYDHGFMIWEKDPLASFFIIEKNKGMKIIITSFIPTAENFAKYLFSVMNIELAKRNIKCEFVEVYETPTSTAKYTRTDYENM